VIKGTSKVDGSIWLSSGFYNYMPYRLRTRFQIYIDLNYERLSVDNGAIGMFYIRRSNRATIAPAIIRPVTQTESFSDIMEREWAL
jgi:hypothetical protein